MPTPPPPVDPVPTRHRAGPGGLTGPDPEPGLAIGSDDEFLLRFGDAIDDRVAEAVEEMLGEPAALWRRARLRPVLAVVALCLAVLASLTLRHNIAAACTVWPSAAAIYLAAIRFTGVARS
jgi:hypothetical protein